MENLFGINFFDSYEDQMSYFTEMTNVNILPMTKGKSVFFRSLGQWFTGYESGRVLRSVSHILPNPAQGMSFPTPLDVLSSTLAMYREVDGVDQDAENLLRIFGLGVDKVTQPIVSLSGGELLLVNYAKAKAMLPTVKGLVACSPVYWLNKARYKYWDLLVSDYNENGKNIDVALLEGEPFPNDNNANDLIAMQQEPAQGIRWKMVAANPTALFPEIQFPTHHPESCIHYFSDASEFELISPTLVTGDNGVGKSILSKLMAGILKPSAGDIFAISENGKGFARLMFQDSIDQIFGMSIDDHIAWVFQYDGTKAKTAQSLYSEMEKSIRKSLHDIYFGGLAALGEAGRRTTLLQAKLCLIAERIASSPPLLILDEPGWGLSKTVSQCLLREACKQAHKQGVAVAIISHQTGLWKGIVQSHIELTKSENEFVKITALETLE